MPPLPTLHSFWKSAVFLAVSLLPLFSHAEEDPAKVTFRNSPQIEVAAITTTTPGAVVIQEGVSDDLREQSDALDGEVRYAKSKLDAAQQKLSAATAEGGSPETLEKAGQEVKDWEARLRTAQAQKAAVEKEVRTTVASTGSGASGGSDVVLPGEVLEVFVTEDPSFNGRYQVRRGGYIIMPQVGRIPVAGKTLDSAEAAVKRALQSSQLQRASVIMERISGADVDSGAYIYLNGEFKTPRPFKIEQGTTPTLVSVLLSCGGWTDKADLTRVKVMRMAANKGVVEEVNALKILEGGSLASDLSLDAGDVITIPVGASNLIYVTGNVKRQGSYHLVPGERLSAYGAILQSGGFARFADLKKVYVLRAMPDGSKAKIPVDIRSVQKGSRPDVQLQSNDIVVVPEKFWSL